MILGEFDHWDNAVCLASGPSLTEADCDQVKVWRAAEYGRGVVVTNTTYQRALWADALFGMDRAWWSLYREDVMARFAGLRYSNNHIADTTYVAMPGCGNSGVGAIRLAALHQPKRIILLGYDGCVTTSATHWHGDHPAPLGNAGSRALWPAQFIRLAQALPVTTEVLNASRHTALTQWPCVDLETALALA